jgi:hypothetical protein
MSAHIEMHLKHLKYFLCHILTLIKDMFPASCFVPPPLHPTFVTCGTSVPLCAAQNMFHFCLEPRYVMRLLSKRRHKQHQPHINTHSRWECHLIVVMWKRNSARISVTMDITTVCCRMWCRVVWLTITDVSSRNLRVPKRNLLLTVSVMMFSSRCIFSLLPWSWR